LPPQAKHYRAAAVAEDFYKEYPFLDTKKAKKTDKKSKELRRTRRYDNWLKQGKEWVKNYRLIVW